LTGEPLDPRLPNVAKRQAGGEIGAEHVRLIRKFLHELPAAVDYQTRDLCEETLTTVAAEHTPAALRHAADRLAALVNPDGEFSDVDRARRRHLSIGKQLGDGMSPITGLLDPEARATLDAVFAKLAAPGMCNPDDQTPCVDGQPLKKRFKAINGVKDNATTMRSKPWAGRCCARVSWVSTTGCRCRSSCPPPCRSWSQAAGGPSPLVAICCR
jgi:Domain of unknown function (DUF222)